MRQLPVVLWLIIMLVGSGAAMAETPQSAEADWVQTRADARGQTVYWNAWGGDSRTNRFIEWVGEQTEQRFGVAIRHVKLSDTSDAVTRVVTEKAAGRDESGSVDLLWINGPNFLSMKEQDLLHGPFVRELPNSRYLDLSPGSASTTDFTVPTEGFESPWRLARFVFNYDSARVEDPPRSMPALLDWARAHPGRFTHPHPDNFMGATFLKQALVELTPDPTVLQRPVAEADFEAATDPLWSWYDRIRPHLWRSGRTFPANESEQQQLLNDGAVDIGMSFDPASTAAAIQQGLLPESARVIVPAGGSIGNVSFVAIPYNARHTAGAKVVANFLLSPRAQARMQDIDVLGAFSVLDFDRLDETARARFESLPDAPALPSREALGQTLPEPHPSWMTRLVEAWSQRYTR
ncbi:ABC transporter substrate-binding protein [Spiribacter vilamensis]|uniref:Putative thiamine transport system substrate-binding protein n=1 Tax=Spiribacter vilamensis TaxID=531306 RepID=A0A4Q8CZA6_9GAMM|nr:ABC transporter substrate-binding protein [Spiribacter vilamensis]RZU98304.1 putative thiamine transport system substrate-binding protein [Spiribacter vilamensis]